MDKLHLWTVWLLVSAEGCLDPCQGKLKDGSQLDHVNNQVAPASNTGPWTWQSHKPSPYLPGGSSMEIEKVARERVRQASKETQTWF